MDQNLFALFDHNYKITSLKIIIYKKKIYGLSVDDRLNMLCALGEVILIYIERRVEKD